MSLRATSMVRGILCCVFAFTTTEPLLAQRAKGKVKDGVYTSPGRNFSVPLPKGIGMKISDAFDDKEGLGAVSFHDDFGSLRGVLYARLPDALVTKFADRALRQDFLEHALEGAAMGTWFLRASPQASIVSQEAITLDTAEDDAFVGLVSLPGGSSLMDVKTGKHLDSTRAILTMQRKNYLYFLMIEVGSPLPGLQSAPVSPAEMATRARPRLIEFSKAITFL
jgi:hypothetical protein